MFHFSFVQVITDDPETVPHVYQGARGRGGRGGRGGRDGRGGGKMKVPRGVGNRKPRGG